MAPVVATASFPLINLPKFYLSFTILVSFILVRYPDRIRGHIIAFTRPGPILSGYLTKINKTRIVKLR